MQSLRSESYRSARFWLPWSADPRGKISTKTAKKNITLKTQIWTYEKKTIQISWFLNGTSSFSIKIRQRIWKFCFVKDSVNFKEITWIRIHFFRICIRIRIRIEIKRILSTGCRTVLRTVNVDLLPQLNENYIKGTVIEKYHSFSWLKIIFWQLSLIVFSIYPLVTWIGN